MVTLSNILKRKEQILALAKAIGFCNICLYKCQDDAYLHLVVDVDRNNPEASVLYSETLSIALSKELRCGVSVIPKSSIKPLFYEDVLRLCAPLLDMSAVQTVFGADSFDKIQFIPYDTSHLSPAEKKEYEKTYKRQLSLFQRISGNSTDSFFSHHPPSTSFFSDSSSSSLSSNSSGSTGTTMVSSRTVESKEAAEQVDRVLKDTVSQLKKTIPEKLIVERLFLFLQTFKQEKPVFFL